MKTMLRFMLLAVLLTLLTVFFRQNADAADKLLLQTENGIIETDTESYVAGALAAEMPAAFPIEALKAQAVAIRSFVRASAPRHEDCDLCTDSSCCMAWYGEEELRELWGEQYGQYRTIIDRACTETAGEYLLYGDEPALAVFHAASLGQTESGANLWGALPYLVSVSSPETAAEYPALVRDIFVSYATLADALDIDLPLITAVVTNGTGRVRFLEADGRSFSGAELRTALELPSTDFSVSPVCGGYLFSVRGRGHGLGMSQYGAAVFAGQGMDYRGILAHYYPGTTVAAG